MPSTLNMCLRGVENLNQKAMYVKSDSQIDHVKEAHTAKSLGKSLLHYTIKHKQNTKSHECQNHSHSSHAFKRREVIKITQIKYPHMEQKPSTNINNQGRTKKQRIEGENLHQ